MSVLTYAGVFDDVVDEYPWPSVQIDEAYINRQLLHNLIYDRAVLVNDGYLITHPVLKQQLISHDTSLAGALFKTGSLVLYHRGAEQTALAAGLESTARASRIQSHLAVIGSREWDKLAPALDWLGALDSVAKRPWSREKNIGEIFYRLMDSVLDRDEGQIGLRHTDKAEFERVMKEYLVHNANDSTHPGARGTWTQAARRTVDAVSRETDPQLRLGELMQIANECYHMAHGLGLLDGDAGRESIAVLTGFSGMFDRYIQHSDPLVSLKNLYRAKDLLILIPDDFKMKDCAPLVGWALSAEFSRIRADYLTKLDGFLRAQHDDKDQYDEVDKAAQAYRVFLVDKLGHEHFGTQWLNRALVESVKLVLFKPLKAINVMLRICGIKVEDSMFKRIAVNDLQRVGASLESRPEVAACVRELGLMQPVLDRAQARPLLAQVGRP